MVDNLLREINRNVCNPLNRCNNCASNQPMLALLFLALMICPGWIYLAATVPAGMRFAQRPIPSGTLPGAAAAPATMLKPLYGAEPGLYENLHSFATQEHPAPQTVLGLRDGGDSAVSVARALIRDLPCSDVALVVESRAEGSNLKVCNLANMLPAARHDLLVISDSDMRVTPDYLATVTAPLGDPRVGLVTCLYRGASNGGLWSDLGVQHINFGFLPSALVGEALGAGGGCFGATMALRRETLERIGGFARLRDELADDHRLGEAVRELDLVVVLSPYLVENRVTEPSFGALWRHELRWARTIRLMAPAGFAGSVLTHPVALSAILVPATGFALTSLAFLVMSCLVRGICAWAFARALGFEAAKPWLLPIRDALSFAVFVASFFGRNVSWRDHAFRVGADGRMTENGDKPG